MTRLFLRVIVCLILLNALPVPGHETASSECLAQEAAVDPRRDLEDVPKPKVAPDYKNEEARKEPEPVAAMPSDPAGNTRQWTSVEIFLSFGILILAVFVIGLQGFLMVKLEWKWSPADLLRFNGLTLIILAALLLVTAGYSDTQISPVLGLLATIGGYLLGSADKNPNP